MSSLMVSLSAENVSRVGTFESAAVWRVTRQSSLELASMELDHGAFDMWLVDAALLQHDPMLWLERVQVHSPQLCVVIFCGSDAGRQRDRLTWLELGAHDVVYWDELKAEMRVSRLAMLLESILHRSRRTMESISQRQLLAKELRGLYRFIHVLGGELDEQTIVKRAMNLFLGSCHKGAIAYIELTEREDHTPHSGELETLFSESEVDLIDDTEASVSSNPSPTSVGDEISEISRLMDTYSLQVMEQASHDRLLVCLGPTMERAWASVLAQRQPVLFRRRPEQGSFHGLEPLWHRLEEGMVFLVPVWGYDDPFGLFVVAELDPGSQDALMLGSEALHALSSLIGSGFEKARRFKEIDDAYTTLQDAQDQLVHAEKFAAVGHLAAQIAHEINNPASFVISNLSVMQEYAETVQTFLRDSVQQLEHDSDRARFIALRDEREIEYIHQDLDVLLERSLAGMQRIHQIVKDLRYFAHDSGPELGWLDVGALLESTLNLVRHEIKYRARLETSYGKVPQVLSDANKLSQVFLNLLMNASQALEHGDPEKDYVRVGTLPFAQAVLVFVEDSGVGMSANVLPRIFDPFFTTKKRGEGSGLGLSISRDILRSLGGDIRVYSEEGQGTRFEIMIPQRYDMPRSSSMLRQSDGYPHIDANTDPSPSRKTPLLPFDPKKMT